MHTFKLKQYAVMKILPPKNTDDNCPFKGRYFFTPKSPHPALRRSNRCVGGVLLYMPDTHFYFGEIAKDRLALVSFEEAIRIHNLYVNSFKLIDLIEAGKRLAKAILAIERFLIDLDTIHPVNVLDFEDENQFLKAIQIQLFRDKVINHHLYLLEAKQAWNEMMLAVSDLGDIEEKYLSQIDNAN